MEDRGWILCLFLGLLALSLFLRLRCEECLEQAAFLDAGGSTGHGRLPHVLLILLLPHSALLLSPGTVGKHSVSPSGPSLFLGADSMKCLSLSLARWQTPVTVSLRAFSRFSMPIPMEGSSYPSQIWVELPMAAELSLPEGTKKGNVPEWDFSRGARSKYLHAPLNVPLQLPCIAASFCPLMGTLTEDGIRRSEPALPQC